MGFQTEQEVFWYDNLTAEQQDLYENLRAQLEAADLMQPGLDDRHTVLRFLKARQWNVHKAVLMYQEMIKWRSNANADELYSTFDFHERSAVRKLYPHFYHKTDIWGRPVYIERLGSIKLDELLQVTTVDRFLSYHIQCCEEFRRIKLPACSRAARRDIITVTVILDLSGFCMSHFSLTAKRFLETIARLDQDNYPEHLGQMLVVNAPFIFRSIWSVVKPLLDDRTTKKIKLLGSSYTDELLKLIPAENLPTFLGGLSEVADQSVDVGPWMTMCADHKAPITELTSAMIDSCASELKAVHVSAGSF